MARVDGELIDLSRPLEENASLRILTSKDPESLQVFRHSAAHLLAAAVLELFPNVKLGIGPPIDNGFFYEFLREQPFTPEDLERIEKKMHEMAAQRHAQRTQDDAQGRGHRALQELESGIQVRIGGGKGRRADGVFLHHRQIHRFLPRAAHPQHRAHSGVQIDERRGRLLERPGRQSADAAHLRRVLLHAAGTRRVSAPAGRGQAARSPAAGNGARSFQHSGGGRAGADLLASQGRAGAQADGRLAARRTAAPRLQSGLHAAHHAAGVVEDQRARQFLSREYVWADGSGERRLSAQAHELPGAHFDLQIAHAQLSRSAGAAGRAGHGLSLRALRRAARASARARLHAGRRAHLLHAQPDRGRGRGLHRFRVRGDEDVWVLALPGGAFGVGRGASGELRRFARGLGTLHQRALQRRSNACRFPSSAWRARRRFTGRRSTSS